MVVRFTPAADAVYLATIRLIAADNPLAARRLMHKVRAARARLGQFPSLGHSIPEFPDNQHRQLLIGPYRFFYRVDGKTVWIVAIWHGKQLPSAPRPLP